MGSTEVKQNSEYNKKKQIHRHSEQTSGYQWREGREEGQNRGRRLRGIDYYV